MLEAERELFGWDHCETGRRLVGDWKLPDDFEAAVAEHHAARRTGGAWDVTELVKVSCAMAGAVGYAAFPGCETTALSRTAGGAAGARAQAVPGRCGNPDARSHRKHPRHRVGVSLRIQLAGLPAKCRYARISLRCNCSSVCPLVSGYDSQHHEELHRRAWPQKTQTASLCSFCSPQQETSERSRRS